MKPCPALATAVVCVAVGCAAVAPFPAASEGARLEAVLDAVRGALIEAQTNDVAGFPPLKSVTVRLQTTATRTAGGGVDFLVFSVGTRATAETASTLELEMAPPPSRRKEALLAANLKDALAQAINLAKAGVLKASSGQPPLMMNKISIDVKFAVEVAGNAGAGVALVPIGVDATGKVSREKVHSVSLVFGE